MSSRVYPMQSRCKQTCFTVFVILESTLVLFWFNFFDEVPPLAKSLAKGNKLNKMSKSRNFVESIPTVTELRFNTASERGVRGKLRFRDCTELRLKQATAQKKSEEG